MDCNGRFIFRVVPSFRKSAQVCVTPRSGVSPALGVDCRIRHYRAWRMFSLDNSSAAVRA